MTYWGNDPYWRSLPSAQRAAAMALLEADKRDPASAKNALGAMINRADREKVDLGEHVSGRIYQPTIEPTQYQRLRSVVGTPQHQELTALAEKRLSGAEPDWVNGNTHFLAHEPTMEQLRAREPGKYRSWVNWTGYNKGGGRYSNPDGQPVFRDASHAFLAPDGRHSAVFGPTSPNEALDGAPQRSPKPMPTPEEEEGFFSKLKGWMNTPIGQARAATQPIRDRYADPNGSLDFTTEEFLKKYPGLDKPGVREQIPAMLDVYRMGRDLNRSAIDEQYTPKPATWGQALGEGLKGVGAVLTARNYPQMGMQMAQGVGADWREQNGMRQKLSLQSALQQAQALTAGSDAAIKDAMKRIEEKKQQNAVYRQAGMGIPFPEVEGTSSGGGAAALPSGTTGVGGVSATPIPVERGTLPDVGAQPQAQPTQQQPQARSPIQSNAASGQSGDDLLRKSMAFSANKSTEELGKNFMEQYKLQQGSPTGQAAERAKVAESLGMKPGDQAYQSYVATGKMPREDQAMLTATDKKAIMEAEELALAGNESIRALKEAVGLGTIQKDPKTGKDVRPDINTGYTASFRAGLADKMPDMLVPDFISSKSSAQNTINYDNLVLGQALGTLKATFGAAPTEGERKILLELQASSGMSPEARKPILERAIGLAERRVQLHNNRANELRGGDYYKPKDGSKSDYKNVPRTSAPGSEGNRTSAEDPLGIR